jgi:hypothetical protein
MLWQSSTLNDTNKCFCKRTGSVSGSITEGSVTCKYSSSGSIFQCQNDSYYGLQINAGSGTIEFTYIPTGTLFGICMVAGGGARNGGVRYGGAGGGCFNCKDLLDGCGITIKTGITYSFSVGKGGVGEDNLSDIVGTGGDTLFYDNSVSDYFEIKCTGGTAGNKKTSIGGTGTVTINDSDISSSYGFNGGDGNGDTTNLVYAGGALQNMYSLGEPLNNIPCYNGSITIGGAGGTFYYDSSVEYTGATFGNGYGGKGYYNTPEYEWESGSPPTTIYGGGAGTTAYSQGSQSLRYENGIDGVLFIYWY